jgi:putative N6-adenine-specific DNA methylase
MPKRPHEVYVIAPPGLEPITARELRGLGLKVPVTAHGGLPVRMTTGELYAANLHLRTASRVLVRAGRFSAADFGELARGIRAVHWDRWLQPGQPLEIRVDSVASALYHTGAIEGRVRDLLGPLGGATVRVRVDHDTATVSIDSSGEHLHRRGWRTDVAKAPLRETLAAAMLLAVGYNGKYPLVDPMCGSGTIAIEAASIAAGHAPGRNRSFAFETWSSFDAAVWEAVRDRAAADEHEPTVAITASDRDAGAVAAVEANAARAGLSIEVHQRALSAPTDPSAWIVTNPPYGERVGGGDMRNLYDLFGKVAAGRTGRVAFLATDRSLATRVGTPIDELFGTSNGGIPVICFAQMGKGDHSALGPPNPGNSQAAVGPPPG